MIDNARMVDEKKVSMTTKEEVKSLTYKYQHILSSLFTENEALSKPLASADHRLTSFEGFLYSMESHRSFAQKLILADLFRELSLNINEESLFLIAREVGWGVLADAVMFSAEREEEEREEREGQTERKKRKSEVLVYLETQFATFKLVIKYIHHVLWLLFDARTLESTLWYLYWAKYYDFQLERDVKKSSIIDPILALVLDQQVRDINFERTIEQRAVRLVEIGSFLIHPQFTIPRLQPLINWITEQYLKEIYTQFQSQPLPVYQELFDLFRALKNMGSIGTDAASAMGAEIQAQRHRAEQRLQRLYPKAPEPPPKNEHVIVRELENYLNRLALKP